MKQSAILRAPRARADGWAGKRIGRVRVIGLAGRKWLARSRQSWLLWVVECSVCGGQAVVSTNNLIARSYASGCGPCTRATMAERCSVKVGGGVTIAQIARATGLKLNTVYQRYHRGWPRHRLGQVAQPRRAHDR